MWDLYDRKNTAKACAPLGAVLTIAAAGSEMSDSSVITKEEGGIKRGYNCDLCRCKFAVMNPELTYTLPAYQTACGAADIMMHVMERYFVTEDTLALTDGMATGAGRRRSPGALPCPPSPPKRRTPRAVPRATAKTAAPGPLSAAGGGSAPR